MPTFFSRAVTIAIAAVALTLAGCSGGSSSSSSQSAQTNQAAASQTASTFTIGGTVSGLASGTTLVLYNSGDDALTLTANGTFIFSAPVSANGSYLVTVNTQPAQQQCEVTNAGGNAVTANVSNVSVTCSTPGFQIGGSVSGLTAGQQVTLINNGADARAVTSNIGFTFDKAVSFDGSYAVAVSAQPAGQICTVSNGTGSGVVATVGNINVNCSATTYTVSGSVSGLASGKQVTLLNNGVNPVIVSSNSAFTFSSPIADAADYTVTVGTQPAGQICSVSNGAGSNMSANISNVAVTCSAQSYTVSATISGLASGQQVTLMNSGADPQIITSNRTVTFDAAVAYNGSYSVAVATSPTVQRCNVTHGAGANVSANVSNIDVVCSFNASFILSPYMYSGDYNYVSNELTTNVTGVIEPTLSAMPARLNAVTWAFATGKQGATDATDTCGSENWDGTSAAAFAAANVASFVNAGKYYVVSTGGSGYNFFCASNANFIKFIGTYYSNNMIGVDFDIESNQTQADINNLVKVVVAAQTQYPNLRYSFTLGTTGGSISPSMGDFGSWVMAAIKTYGLKNYTINLMTMNFIFSGGGNSGLCVLNASNLCEMGSSAIVAAENLHNYYGVPYSQIELTPMIGGNEDHDEIFTIADAATISNFVVANKLAGVHFWAFSRDRDCNPSTVDDASSDSCNNYGKAGTLGFTNAFIADLAPLLN